MSSSSTMQQQKLLNLSNSSAVTPGYLPNQAAALSISCQPGGSKYNNNNNTIHSASPSGNLEEIFERGGSKSLGDEYSGNKVACPNLLSPIKREIKREDEENFWSCGNSSRETGCSQNRNTDDETNQGDRRMILEINSAVFKAGMLAIQIAF